MCWIWLKLRITVKASVPEMHILSILLMTSDLKWCLYLSGSLFLYFNYLMSITAGGPEGVEGRWRQVRRSTLVDSQRVEKSRLSVLNLIEIVILSEITQSLYASGCFGTILASLFSFTNCFVWLRITGNGSVPEMHKWYILLMKSDLKWCS